MPAFLSDEWIDALAEAAAHASTTPDVRLAIRQVVGEVSWTVSVRDGSVTVDREPRADLTLTTDAATAAALASGELATPDALAAGRLQLTGDLAALLAAADALGGLDAVYAGVRDSTTFDG